MEELYAPDKQLVSFSDSQGTYRPILVVFKHFRNPQHPYDPICIEIDEPEPAVVGFR
jgi:hypothetical protein